MGRLIAVSESLSPLKRVLHQEGYEVINLENEAEISKRDVTEYDAVVVSGMDLNMMGMQDISGRAIIINATGKKPHEIVEELRSRL